MNGRDGIAEKYISFIRSVAKAYLRRVKKCFSRENRVVYMM
ncbi:hypothetical protein [Candidatus Jordarchaeum sp.]